ncbi:MAG: hypothetical protein J0H55_12770 [Chitinophagaceae bacterium]|nr:hypothetical protein [Chitinophagaceae bacterium]
MKATSSDIEELLKSLSEKDGDIEEIVQNAPASSLARLLLLKKKIQENHPDAENLKQQLAFYTGNFPWYEFVLTYLERGGEVDDSLKEIVEKEIADEEPVSEKEPLSDSIPEISQEENITDQDSKEEEKPAKPEINEIAEEEHPPVLESTQASVSADEKMITENITLSSLSSEEETEQQDENQPAPVKEIEKEEIEEPSEEFVNPENEVDIKKEKEVSLPFEPLHTVDYFASQGIKMNEDDFKEDKLAQQVKSFTGWLKSMKRLHGKLPEQDEAVERIIRNESEVSNREEGILTEAMAEVLVKQNRKDKAVEIYRKLSLMNPSKSAYFAAKIESLIND